jgi:hypothetical protein
MANQQPPSSQPRISDRALNRATLARQLLLRRVPRGELSVAGAVEHLVGLQAQNVKPPYYALAARLDGFDPGELSALMASREVARTVTMRSTIHTHTAADALALRPLLQPGAPDRELRMFRARGGLDGVDPDRLTALARALVEERPRTMAELRQELLVHWPGADPLSLSIAARCSLPLVQVTPRGLWGRSGQVTLTTAEHWFGRPAGPPADPAATALRYLAAFGPASVKDMQTWSGLTRMRSVFEALRPGLVIFRDDRGNELFDLPDAPRPAEDTPAPVRLLPEYDNLLLSHADRTRFLADPGHTALTWRGNLSYPVFLLDGRLAGIWQHTEEERKGTGERVATLTLQPFAPVGRARRGELTEEAARTLAAMSPDAVHEITFGTLLEW